MAAMAVRHPQVSERVSAGGKVELVVPRTKSRLGRWLSGSDAPVVRRFELDELGGEVWRMIDGKTTVRMMIERFATAHQLSLREAEVSMLAYLRMLTERGIMVLAWPEDKTGNEG